MPFDISIKHDLKKMRRELTAIERRAVPAATVRTLNRVGESARVASAKHIAPKMNSRQAAVKRRIEKRNASRRKLWLELVAKHRPVQLIDFVIGSKKPTQQPGGKRGLVKAKVYGKVRTLPHAFIAPRRKGSGKTTVYQREERTHLPLKLLYGPSIMQLFKQRENDAIMQAKVRERTPIEFASSLKYYVSRTVKR